MGRGELLVQALQAKDTAGLMDLFAPDLEFRALTPGRVWEADSARTAVQDVLWVWFRPDETIEAVDELATADVLGRERVDYRLRVRNAKGEVFLVEQRAYLDYAPDGRIRRAEVICAGFRRIST